MTTARTDRLANAIVAVGGPDKRCAECGTNAYALARLALEVYDQLEDEDLSKSMLENDVALADDNVRSLGQRLTEERGLRYSHPKDNFRRIGAKWAATLDLDRPIPPALVGIMMMDVKTSRLVSTPDDEDSLDDIEGYVEAQRMLFR